MQFSAIPQYIHSTTRALHRKKSGDQSLVRLTLSLLLSFRVARRPASDWRAVGSRPVATAQPRDLALCNLPFGRWWEREKIWRSVETHAGASLSLSWRIARFWEITKRSEISVQMMHRCAVLCERAAFVDAELALFRRGRRGREWLTRGYIANFFSLMTCENARWWLLVATIVELESFWRSDVGFFNLIIF